MSDSQVVALGRGVEKVPAREIPKMDRRQKRFTSRMARRNFLFLLLALLAPQSSAFMAVAKPVTRAPVAATRCADAAPKMFIG